MLVLSGHKAGVCDVVVVPAVVVLVVVAAAALAAAAYEPYIKYATFPTHQSMS